MTRHIIFSAVASMRQTEALTLVIFFSDPRVVFKCNHKQR